MKFSQFLSSNTIYIVGFFGYVSGIATMFLNGFSSEFFAERARKATHKREVARHVLKLCNEASTGNFRNPPRDNEHINSIMTDLRGIDKQKGSVLEKFVTYWRMIASGRIKNDISFENEKHTMELLDDVRSLSEELIVWADKIRIG